MKQQKVKQAWGIASLATAILSLIIFLMPYFGLPLAILSMIFYTVQEPKTGISTAGLVVGIISTVLNSIIMVLLIIALMLGF